MRIGYHCLLLLFLFALFSMNAKQLAEQHPDQMKIKAETFLSAGLLDSALFWYNKAATSYLAEKNTKEYLICKNQESFVLGRSNKTNEALKVAENVLDEYIDSLSFYKLDAYFYWKKSLFNYRLAKFPAAFRYGKLAKEKAILHGIFNREMKNEITEIL